MRHLSRFLAGDFNRSPDRLENDLMTEHLERVVAVLAPTEPTQIGGGIFRLWGHCRSGTLFTKGRSIT